MNQWKIGKVRVTRIVEMQVVGGTKFILPDASREVCLPISWMQPHFMDESGNLIMSIHALVIDDGERHIVVDTCIGNDKERNIPSWTNLQTSFLKDLEQAGYPRHSVDMVMCTHLHVDHVGWNTMLVDDQWVPTFPKARYLMAKKEWAYWSAHAEGEAYGPVIDDSVRPIIECELAEFVEDDYELTPEVRLIATPGHTPGHVSVWIESEGSRALITGDCIHHPVQMTRTDWFSSADFDQDQTRATRETLLKSYVDSDVLIIGTHFATLTAGYIRSLGKDSYWLDVV